MISNNIKNCSDVHKNKSGFSLAEILAALTIGAMVLVAILTIYNRAQNSVAAITQKFDQARLPQEVLQRIAEDLDGIIAAGDDTKIIIPQPKFDNGFSTAKLEITKTFNDRSDKKQVFEKIVWQTAYDYDSELDGLVLYRSHSGITMEDKLLDEEKDIEDRELFIPICEGVTFFKIQVPVGEQLLDQWNSSSLPRAVTVTISFAEPFEAEDNNLDVPEELKVTRTIAIDRTRKIRIELADPNEEDTKGIDDLMDLIDTNSIKDVNNVKDINSPEDKEP